MARKWPSSNSSATSSRRRKRKKRARSKKPSKPKANPPPQRLHGPLRETGAGFFVAQSPEEWLRSWFTWRKGCSRRWKPFTVKELSEKSEPLLAEKPEQAKTRGVREGLS